MKRVINGYVGPGCSIDSLLELIMERGTVLQGDNLPACARRTEARVRRGHSGRQ